MDAAKAGGGRGAGRSSDGSSSNAAATSGGGGKKKRSKARKKAAAAATTAAPSAAASLGGAAAGGNGAKKAANAPQAPKILAAVVDGNAGKMPGPPAQQQQQQQSQPKKKKNRKRLHNGGKVAAANRAAGNEGSAASSNATQGATELIGAGNRQALVVTTGSRSNATKLRPQTAGVVQTGATAASNAERAAGVKGSILKSKIRVKRKIDEATSATAQTISGADRGAGKSRALQPSASKAATSSHDVDSRKQPPTKKLKVVNSAAQVKKQKASLADESVPAALNRPASTPVAVLKPTRAPLQQSNKPQSAVAAARSQAAITQETAPIFASEPVEIESNATASMEVDAEAPNAPTTEAELPRAVFAAAAEHFSEEESLSETESSDIEVIEVEDSEPDSPKASSLNEAFDAFPPATTPTADSFEADSAIVSTDAVPADALFSHNATYSDDSAVSTPPSPVHEAENELWPFLSPQQDPLSGVREDPSASSAATDMVESVSPHERSAPDNVVKNESAHADDAHETGASLILDGAPIARESVDVLLHEESVHEATSSSSTECKEEQKEDYCMREESERTDAQEKEVTEKPVIHAQGDGEQTAVASSLMQAIVIPPPVRTPPKSEWLPPRPASVWGASFGMKITPDRTSAALLSASSPALVTSPLSSWFLSKGQANFMQQVAFPPRASSERHHRRSVSPQRVVTKSHAQNTSSSLETALIANQEDDDDAEDGKRSTFLESLTQQASWRTWYGNVDQKDLLDPPLQQLPAEVRQALVDATGPDDSGMGAPGNQISSREANENTSIADLEDEIRAERDNASAFTRELMLMLQGKTLSGKPLEEEYRALLAHGDP